MKYKSTRTGISSRDLAQDRAFWRELLARGINSCALPTHSGAGYRNRRFAIIRNAVWITCSPGMGRLPPSRDDRCRGVSSCSATLEQPCGRTAYCVDAPGRRCLVDLLRVAGRRCGRGSPELEGLTDNLRPDAYQPILPTHPRAGGFERTGGRPDHCARAAAGVQFFAPAGDQMCPIPEEAAASAALSATRLWVNLSSPFAVIAATANVRVVPRTFPPRAFPVRGSGSSKANQSATQRRQIAATTSSVCSAVIAARRSTCRLELALILSDFASALWTTRVGSSPMPTFS